MTREGQRTVIKWQLGPILYGQNPILVFPPVGAYHPPSRWERWKAKLGFRYSRLRYRFGRWIMGQRNWAEYQD